VARNPPLSKSHNFQGLQKLLVLAMPDNVTSLTKVELVEYAMGVCAFD